MPRPMWSGSISFGLVSIPVKLYSAVTERPVRFNQVDARNGARIRQKRVNEVTGEEIEYADIAKGYEISKDKYLIVTDDELTALAADATHRLDLECFVDLDEIDPIFYDGAYHVAPSKSAKPYALLVQAMQASNKVAIARFVMRSKEHVAVLRPKDDALVMSMMVYADELNSKDELGEFEELDNVEVSDRELAMAESLIESLSEPFIPENYHDTYRERVMQLIEQKSAGIEITTAAPAARNDNVVDLMDALQASLVASKAARKRHPTAVPADEEEGAEDEGADVEVVKVAPAKKAAAKRAPAKKTPAKTAAKAPAKPKRKTA